MPAQVKLANPVYPVYPVPCADRGPAPITRLIHLPPCLSAVEYGFHRSGPFCAVSLGTRVVRAAVMFRVLRRPSGNRGMPAPGAAHEGLAEILWVQLV
jgi:hypothetical protein